MPDFRAYLSTVPTLEPWLDPAEPLLPSRINPVLGREHLRRQCAVGHLVEIVAVPFGGSAGPLDSQLGGRLFVGWLAEWAEPKPLVTSPPNQSSIRRFTPQAPGHYCYVLHRAGGGGCVLHLDVIS